MITPLRPIRRRDGRESEHGQVIVLFALCLIVMVAMAGVLVDGGRAWSDRRLAQSAADTAALAAAKAFSVSGPGVTAANEVAKANGFAKDLVTCAGATQLDKGVIVSRPPLSGPHSLANDPLHANDYVEVNVTRRMNTTFAAAVGQGCWLVSARAVAQLVPATPGGPTILALSTTCGGSDSGIHWNGHRTVVTQGDVISNGDIDMPGSGSVLLPGVMTYQCNWFEHGNPANTATKVMTFASDPFTYTPTLGDFDCQDGPLPAKLTLPADVNDPKIPPGTYCATDSVEIRSAKGTLPVTGNITLIAPQVTFNADPMNLRPSENGNGVLAWATGDASSAINFKAEGEWGGILYAPNGGIHVTSKANSVVEGNIWGRNVDLGGDDWSIAGPKGSALSTAIVKLVE